MKKGCAFCAVRVSRAAFFVLLWSIFFCKVVCYTLYALNADKVIFWGLSGF